MDPLGIINKYYDNSSKLYTILYVHSLSVADKAMEIAKCHPEMEIDLDFLYEAALLHDIGIIKTDAPEIGCLGTYPYICHGYLGAEMLIREGWEKHALVCERHTGSGITRASILENQMPLPVRDMLPVSIEEKLVCFADKFYSKSHPEKVKSIDKIKKSLSKYGNDSVTRFDAMVKLFLG